MRKLTDVRLIRQRVLYNWAFNSYSKAARKIVIPPLETENYEKLYFFETFWDEEADETEYECREAGDIVSFDPVYTNKDGDSALQVYVVRVNPDLLYECEKWQDSQEGGHPCSRHETICQALELPENGTYWQHPYPCCGHWYYGRPRVYEIDYDEGAYSRKLLVELSSHQNV